MTDHVSFFRSLRRPRLLLRAARFGLSDYNRDRDLRRLLGRDRAPSIGQALERLIAAEDRMEQDRKAGDASYNVCRHIEIMVALIAEARLIRRLRPG